MISIKPHEKQNKKHQNAKSNCETWKLRVWCSLFHFFFHVVWRTFDMWPAKHLSQASCTKLTLLNIWLSFENACAKIRMLYHSAFHSIVLNFEAKPSSKPIAISFNRWCQVPRDNRKVLLVIKYKLFILWIGYQIKYTSCSYSKGGWRNLHFRCRLPWE